MMNLFRKFPAWFDASERKKLSKTYIWKVHLYLHLIQNVRIYAYKTQYRFDVKISAFEKLEIRDVSGNVEIPVTLDECYNRYIIFPDERYSIFTSNGKTELYLSNIYFIPRYPLNHVIVISFLFLFAGLFFLLFKIIMPLFRAY